MNNKELKDFIDFWWIDLSKLIGKKYKELKEQSKMTNEEINVLINLHIDELEHGIEPTEIQKKRIIKALRQATDLIDDYSHIPRID